MEFNCFLSFLLIKLFNFNNPLTLFKIFKININKKNKPKCLYKILISHENITFQIYPQIMYTVLITIATKLRECNIILYII